MRLDVFLKRGNNNLDLIRIVAAIMVIYGHSFYLANAYGEKEPIKKLLEFTYSGTIAVMLFFFISGILVTNSILNNDNVKKFIVSRFFRIYPAFFAVIIITSFIIGPLITKMNYHNYFSSEWFLYYVKNNLLLNISYNLPGVFGDNIYKNAVNGSLWTISWEVYCYMLVASIYVIFGKSNKNILSLICVTIILMPYLNLNNDFFISSTNKDAYLLAPIFACGALFAINKEKITLNIFLPISFFVLFIFVKAPDIKYILFYLFTGTSALYLSSMSLIKRINIKYDISYGVYLWGFLIQQLIYMINPNLSLITNQLLCIILSIIAGFLSYVLIEKPFMSLAKKINSRIN